jgi:hypothetical protein
MPKRIKVDSDNDSEDLIISKQDYNKLLSKTKPKPKTKDDLASVGGTKEKKAKKEKKPLTDLSEYEKKKRAIMSGAIKNAHAEIKKLSKE